METSDRRRAQRIRFTSKAIIRYEHGRSLETAVNTRDISLQGMFLETETRIPLATPCSIQIQLSGSSSSMHFTVQGIICRHDPVGLAIDFTHLDPDSALHILNLVKLHGAAS
jgi:hypothetical protein